MSASRAYNIQMQRIWRVRLHSGPLDELWYKVLFGTGIAALAVYEIWFHFFRRSKCGGRIRLDEYKDSMGHNVSKTMVVTFWKGPRKNTEIWKCKECDDTQTRKYWSWR